MKDWELLRDELVSIEEELNAKANSDIDNELAAMMEGGFGRSPFRDAKSEESLANKIEATQRYCIRKGILTREIVERYSDFFDRTGLETDLEKAATPYTHDKRKEICRNYRRSVGRQLKEMRNKRGYTLREVEEATGIAKNIISRTEAGRANTTIDTLSILADYYRIGPVEICDMTGLPTLDEIG